MRSRKLLSADMYDGAEKGSGYQVARCLTVETGYHCDFRLSPPHARRLGVDLLPIRDLLLGIMDEDENR